MAADAHDPLANLSSSYPAFWFTQEIIGRHGDCWVARRKDGLSPGLHTVITSDLAELHAVLASPEGARAAVQDERG
jgi:hypothetical protein